MNEEQVIQRVLEVICPGYDDIVYLSKQTKTSPDQLIGILRKCQALENPDGKGTIWKIKDDFRGEGGTIKFPFGIRGIFKRKKKTGNAVSVQEQFPDDIVKEANEILKNGDPLHFILKTIQKHHVGDIHTISAKRLMGVSPWVCGSPIHDYSVGESGKGKSDSSSKILSSFPKESYVTLTDLSPKSPYYARKSGLMPDRCIIFFDDVRVTEDGIAMLKALTSGGLVKPRLWTVKEQEFLNVLLDGVYSVFLSSVNPVNDSQVKNRFIITNPDQSSEQDERVWKYQDRTLRMSSEEKSMESNRDLIICRAMTQILVSEVDDFVIPFNIIWAMKFDRRLYPFFLTMIKCVSKHYKLQRRRTGDGKIICTKGDFLVVSEIWENIKTLQATKSSRNTALIYDALHESQAVSETSALTYTEISKKTKLGTQTVKYACYELEAMGLVNKEKRNRKNFLWLSVISVKNRQFTNLTDKGVACDGFDLSVISSGAITEEMGRQDLELYINSSPSDVLTFLKNQQQADMPSVKNTPMTASDGPDTCSKIRMWRDSGEPTKDCDISYLMTRWKLTYEEIEKARREGVLFEPTPGRFSLV